MMFQPSQSATPHTPGGLQELRPFRTPAASVFASRYRARPPSCCSRNTTLPGLGYFGAAGIPCKESSLLTLWPSGSLALLIVPSPQNLWLPARTFTQACPGFVTSSRVGHCYPIDLDNYRGGTCTHWLRHVAGCTTEDRPLSPLSPLPPMQRIHFRRYVCSKLGD